MAAAVETFPAADPESPANGKGGRIVEVPENAPENAPEPPRPSPATPSEALNAARANEAWLWLWLLWERRQLIARAVVWGLAVSTVIAFLIPKKYQSTTRLMPPDGQSGSGLAMLAAMAGKSTLGSSSLAGSLLGQRTTGALFVDILRGRTVEDRIIARFDLRQVYGKRYWVDARKRLDKNTEVDEDRKSEVITIRVTDRDPRRAAAMAQAYVDELDHLVAEVSTSSARRERIFIEGRLTNVRNDLDQASREFSRFSSENATLDLSAQGKAMVEAAGRLQGELIAAQSELEGLEQIYAPNNVRVRSLRARVEELSKQLDKLGGSRGNAAVAASAGDPSEAGPEFPSIRQLPLLGVRWAELYRQVKIEETVYELLTQQYELAKIEEAKEIPTVKILDAADVPERKSSPPRTLIVVLGTLVAGTVGAGWIVGGSWWETVDSGEPRKALALAVAVNLRPIWARVRRWRGNTQGTIDVH